MGILGKRYPHDVDEHRRSGLNGEWNSKQAGQRMRLKVPETWETQVYMCFGEIHVPIRVANVNLAQWQTTSLIAPH